jgi:hypothetical protein
MKRFLILICIFISLHASVNSQSKTFDIISFNPPPGWERSDKSLARTYTNVDNSRGIYGLIAIYPSVKSSGDPQKDFTASWNGLVKPDFGTGIGPVPVPASQQEGYTGLQGTSYGMSSGKQTTVTLINYTGGGKTLSIILNYSDDKYEPAISKFVQSIKLKSLK